MPKIIDQTEISGAPRASNQQHLSEPWKYSKISRNIYDYFHFIDMLGARGMAEISDRSMIFGLWCHMSVHIKLYAYMTLIFENMIKNSKIMLKMRFLQLKYAQNGISKFDMLIYFYVKNHQKMLLMLFFLDLASLDTICQKSLIRQKFRAPRAPQISNIYQSVENIRKFREIFTIIFILLIC